MDRRCARARYALGSVECDLLSTALRVLQCPASARRSIKRRRRVFLWSLVGISYHACRERDRSSDRVRDQPLSRKAMAGGEAAAECHNRSASAGRRTRGVENYTAESVTSIISDEFT